MAHFSPETKIVELGITESPPPVVDFSNYYTKEQVDVALSQATGADLSAYYTKTQIDTIAAAKVAIDGIVNDLNSTDTTKPLSAAQGKALKTLIDNIMTLLGSDNVNLDTLQEIVDFIELNRAALDALGISNIAGLQNALNAKADAGHSHDSIYAAIGHSHTELHNHTNKATLDKIGESGSNMTFNGQPLSGGSAGVGTSELPAYSTNEVLTAERWTNGKPIYKRTFTVDPNAGVVNFGNIPNVTPVKDNWAIDGSGTYNLVPVANGTPFVVIAYQKSSGNLYAQEADAGVWNSSTFASITFTFHYTKDGDTAASPVALVGSAQSITTGVEYVVPEVIDGKQVYGKRIDCGAMPNATTKSIAHGLNISTLSAIWIDHSSSFCFRDDGGVYKYSRGFGGNSDSTLSVTVIEGNINIYASHNFSLYTKTFITLHYTK